MFVKALHNKVPLLNHNSLYSKKENDLLGLTAHKSHSPHNLFYS